MFCMTNDFFTVFQTLLKTFAEEGLLKAVGENVSKATAQIKSESERFLEVNQLPLEVPTYVL